MSEPKFKVGDRARVVAGEGRCADYVGKTGTVAVVYSDHYDRPLYTLTFGDYTSYGLLWEEELASAPEPGLPLPMEASLTEQAHYVTGGVEAIDFIEANGLGFCLGNAAKYIARAGKKGGPEDHVADLEKARNYITREINRLRGTPGWEAK